VKGIKHIIECHCVLPQYKTSPEAIYHKFVVFSVIDEGDTVIPKYAQCNNCSVIHRVFDMCKSEIVGGKDESTSIIKKEDITPFLPSSIVEILDSYSVEIPSYEEAKFIMDNHKWGSFLILSRENIKDEIAGKRLLFEAENKFKIEDFIARHHLGK